MTQGGRQRARKRRCVAAACCIYPRNRAAVGRLRGMCGATALAHTSESGLCCTRLTVRPCWGDGLGTRAYQWIWALLYEAYRATLLGWRARHSPTLTISLTAYKQETPVVCPRDWPRLGYREAHWSPPTDGPFGRRARRWPPPLSAPSPSLLEARVHYCCFSASYYCAYG